MSTSARLIAGALALAALQAMAAPAGAPGMDLDAALAADPYPQPPSTPRQVLIRNATVWTMAEPGIEEGTDVLIDDGVIAAVGKNLAAGGGALVIDATGRHVTPGIIDAHSHSATEAMDLNEGVYSLSSEVRVRDVLDPRAPSIYQQLAGGVTTAHVLHGSANAIGGQNQIVKYRWGVQQPADLVMVDAPPTIKFALGENPTQAGFKGMPGREQRYPGTRQGVAAFIRSSFERAKQYRDEWARYDKLSKGQREKTVPPRRDLQLDALVAVLDDKRFIHAHSYRADEILMLMRVADELGIHVTMFHHVLEGYRVADEMAAHGAAGTTFSDWWAFKMEAYQAIPYNAAIMAKRGVLVSLNSDDGNLARRLNLEAAKTVHYGGLDRQQALAMVTLNPAKQLKIDKRVGSLVKGKDADLVIWSGDPLSVYSVADLTFVDGKIRFSRELDVAHRAEVAQARERLTAEMKAAADKAKAEKPAAEPAPAATTAEASPPVVVPPGTVPDTVSTASPSRPAAPAAPAGKAQAAPAPSGDAAKPEAAKIPEDWVNPPAPKFNYTFARGATATPVAIVGATVHTLEGPAIANGVVVFERGRITAVGGADTPVPAGAERVDAAGKHLWPGLIHAFTVLGLMEIDTVAGSVDTTETGEINADADALVAVNPDSEHFPVARSAGITQAMLVPNGGTISGIASLLRTDGWTWEEMSAVRQHSLVLRWPDPIAPQFTVFLGPSKSLPDRKKEDAERVKTLNDLLDDAEAYGRAKKEAVSSGRKWEYDAELEALQPVICRERPLYASAREKIAIEAAVEFAAKRNLRLVITDGRDAYLVTDLLAKHKVPVILTNIAGDVPRADDPYDVLYSLPAKLEAAGVPFAIASGTRTGGSGNARNFTLFAGLAAAHGLDREAAYKSVTLYPAQILGVDDVLGSIKTGKSASLVLTDGDLLEATTNVEQVWIDGTKPSMDDVQKAAWRKWSARPEP